MGLIFKYRLKIKDMTKEEIVTELVSKWGMKKESFYNSATSKSVEKFWTLNRCRNFLNKLEREYIYNPLTNTKSLK